MFSRSKNIIGAIAQHVHFGGGVVRPTHRDFGGAQAVALREKQNFGIETEAFDALLFEDYARRLADGKS